MAHPKRKEYVEYLLSVLGDVPVIWDQKNCVWDTRRRCLEQHIEAGAKWSLTLQDDSLLTQDFLKKAEAFMAQHDRPRRRVYSFNFYFWSRDGGLTHYAKRRGYYRKAGMKSGVAVCLATELIPDLLKMWEGTDRLIRHDDSRIGIFLKKRKLRTMYPCPSLVQHRDEQSLIYKPEEVPFTRQALYYDQ